MNPKNSNLEEALTVQLKAKGIAENQIPLFIKDLINTLSDTDSLDLTEINNRLYVLGWTGVKLDYHAVQLAKACFEGKRGKEGP